MARASRVPAGWPAEVPPPDAPGWERRAGGWLFDQCPADLRAHEVLRRHPLVLAYVAAGQVDGALQGLQGSLASIRADLRDALSPAVLAEAVAALQQQQAQLEATRRSVRLVAEALRGVRHRPRL
jgi:hypothetical protein